MALASRSGPTPPKRSLAAAIHHALAGPRVAGVTARIRFSNHLLASGVLPDSSQPLLSGATGRLWATGGKARLEPAAAPGPDPPAPGRGRQGPGRAPGRLPRKGDRVRRYDADRLQRRDEH